LLNTLASRLVQRGVKIDYTRELLRTQDGGLLAIDWANLQAHKKLVLLVLPGLTGCSKDNYVTHLVEKAKRKDCIAVVMNYRGIEVELKTPRSYSAASLDDVQLVIKHIRERYKNHKIMAVGVSLGGIILGGYLAKNFNECLVSNALIVSAPFNVNVYADEMERFHNFYIFNRFFTKDVGKYFERYV
jgi:abhydrolase domain-containing protein 1/3